MSEEKLRPVGRIDFLDTKGQTGESCYYYSEEDFLKTVKEENYYGVPMVVKEILSAICYDDSSEAEQTGIGTIDFNKITPMPPSLDIESGSSTDRGINLYLTSVNPSVRYYGKEKMDPVAFTSLVERLNGSRSFLRHNAALTPEEIQNATLYHSEDELLQLGKTAVENLMQYGATTWYDWRTRGDTWNTKWNSYNAYDYNGGNEICFQTAWSAPHPIIEKLSSMTRRQKSKATDNYRSSIYTTRASRS